jgi:hypothetical protein
MKNWIYLKWDPLFFSMAAGGALGPRWAVRARIEAADYKRFLKAQRGG